MKALGVLVVCILCVGSVFSCFAQCSGRGCAQGTAGEWAFDEANGYFNVLPRPPASWFAKAGASEASFRWDLSNFYDGNFILLTKLQAGVTSGEILTGTVDQRAQWQQVIRQAKVLPFPWKTAGIAQLIGGRARLITDEKGFSSIGQELVLNNKSVSVFRFSFTAVDSGVSDMLEVVAIFTPVKGEVSLPQEVVLGSYALRSKDSEEVSIPIFNNQNFQKGFAGAGQRRVEMILRIKGDPQKPATVDVSNFNIGS